MFDGVDKIPAFVDHFVLVKINDTIKVAPTGIDKPTYFNGTASWLINERLAMIECISAWVGDVWKRIYHFRGRWRGGAFVLFIFSNVEQPVLNNQTPNIENKSSRLTINITSKIDYE